MTKSIFYEYISKWDKELIREGRKYVLLLISHMPLYRLYSKSHKTSILTSKCNSSSSAFRPISFENPSKLENPSKIETINSPTFTNLEV